MSCKMTGPTQCLAVRHVSVVAVLALGWGAGCATGSADSFDASGLIPVMGVDSGHVADGHFGSDTGSLLDTGTPPVDATAHTDSGGHDGAMSSGDGQVTHDSGESGDSAMSNDTGAHDAGHDAGVHHDAGHDAGHDSGSGSCTVVSIPSGTGGAGACPSPVSGTCAPGGLSGFTPSAPPPIPSPGSCTTAQIQQLYNDCLGSGSSELACNDDANNIATCYNCTFGSNETDSSWGPLLSTSNGLVVLNEGGCLTLLEPCNAPCGQIIEKDTQCEVADCAANCPITSQSASLTAYDNCLSTTDGCDPGGCATYANGGTCSQSVTGASHPGSVCFPASAQTTFEQLFVAIVPVFCKN
jgi:hypothetical protein